jgi:high-affinity Fe2+/Pb2+ permease
MPKLFKTIKGAMIYSLIFGIVLSIAYVIRTSVINNKLVINIPELIATFITAIIAGLIIWAVQRLIHNSSKNSNGEKRQQNHDKP